MYRSSPFRGILGTAMRLVSGGEPTPPEPVEYLPYVKITGVNGTKVLWRFGSRQSLSWGEGTLEYSENGTEWQSLTSPINGLVVETTSNTLYLRGSGITGFVASTLGSYLQTDGDYLLMEGTLEALLDYQSVMNGVAPDLAVGGLARFFKSATQLKTLPLIMSTSIPENALAETFLSSGINLSSTPLEGATTYRIPASGTATAESGALAGFVTQVDGIEDRELEVNTTYYITYTE